MEEKYERGEDGREKNGMTEEKEEIGGRAGKQGYEEEYQKMN